MKQINENRIIHTQKYIEEYHDAHDSYPTYREIKDECEYSSLSLVYSDISRLEEKGFLVKDKKNHFKLSNKTREVRYDYPFIIMTNAFENYDRLNQEEKLLLDSQDNFLKGNYQLANSQAEQLLQTSADQSVLFGAKFTKCCTALYLGNTNAWKEFFRTLVAYQCKNLSETMEKELMVHFLTSALGEKENCPIWLKEGRFYGLRNKALPLARLNFVSNIVTNDMTVSPSLLEPLCSESKIEKIDISQVYMDLYLAMAYHYQENDKYINEHLKAAIKTCVNHGWITPLAEMKKPLESILKPVLEEYGSEFVNKVDNLQKELHVGYEKIYKELFGENIVKGLNFREIEIVNYVRLNLSTKEIADKLYLSSETIKYYLSSIFLKLGVQNRHELKELVKKAIVR